PTVLAVPALDVGRGEEGLAHAGHLIGQLLSGPADSEGPDGADDELGRAADPGPVAGRGVKIARLEEVAEEPLDIEPGPLQEGGGFVDDLGSRLGGREEAEELGGDPPRG